MDSNRPLIMGRSNEGIKFVEDDDSSTDCRIPEIVFTASPLLQDFVGEDAADVAEHTDPGTSSAEEPSSGHHDSNRHLYADVSPALLSPRGPTTLLSMPSRKSRCASDIALNVFHRSPSGSKSQAEYEKVPTQPDDSYYCTIRADSIKRKLSRLNDGHHSSFRRPDQKAEEDNQILEVLRQVVRKCTSLDPLKRPCSKDIMDLVTNVSDKS